MPATATPPTAAPHLFGQLLWLTEEAAASLSFAVAMFAALSKHWVRGRIVSPRRARASQGIRAQPVGRPPL
jgi:hypothetical protein